MVEQNQFIQWLATLGVGGILAAFMFNFYRKDMKENADNLKFYIDSYRADVSSWKEVVIQNTKAMAECAKMTELVFHYLVKTEENNKNEVAKLV